MNHTTYSAYVIAIILLILSLPIIFVSGIISVVQEVRRIRATQSQGEKIGYMQPKLLSGLASALFVLAITAAGVVYACISYRVLPTTLNWVVIALAVLAGLFGILYVTQVVSGKNKSFAQ